MRNTDTYCKECGHDYAVKWPSGEFVPDCTCDFSNRLEARLDQPPRRLHLGCGKRTLEGWTGIDSREDVDADVVADVRHLDQWASGEVDSIYACHVLEHIPRPDLLPTLREWRRVLIPGGILRVSVPSFEAVVDLYADGVSFWRLAGLLYGRQDYEGNTHFIGFDYEYLAWLLAEAGFYHIHRYTPQAWLPEGYDDYSLARIDHRYVSLNLEATA